MSGRMEEGGGTMADEAINADAMVGHQTSYQTNRQTVLQHIDGTENLILTLLEPNYLRRRYALSAWGSPEPISPAPSAM